MKIWMKVENVALAVVRPSQISLRLNALLDKNRRRRPLSRATKWLALLLTVGIIPLLAAARAANDSSPEKTVRAFVAALNSGHFEEAVRYVDGKAPNPDFTTLRQTFRQDKPSFSLSALTTTTQGSKATVKVTLTIRSTGQRATRQVQTGNVAMVRRGTHWLIAPLLGAKNPYINQKTSDLSFLTSIAGILQSPQTFETAREQARSESCKSNLKQIALAAFQLSQEKHGLAMTPQNFKDKLFPYLKTMQIFRCPSVFSGESYSFNGNLWHRKIESLPHANHLVMFYEGKNGQLDFRHDGKTNVAFADGHVETISREEAKTLRWNLSPQ